MFVNVILSLLVIYILPNSIFHERMEQGITCFVFCFLFVVVVLCGWLVSWLVVYFSATHEVIRKKNSRRLNHARNIFRKNLQLIGAVCQMVVKQKIEKKIDCQWKNAKNWQILLKNCKNDIFTSINQKHWKDGGWTKQ